jgi:hypothetical protein
MYSNLAAIAAVSVAFVLDGLKTTNQSRHDVYEDVLFSYVWFQAKAFPDILLDSETSSTADMGSLNNAAVCRNSNPVCYMRCCMIFSSVSCQRNAVRIVAATLFPLILPSSHRKVNYAEQEALILFSGRHSHSTVVSAEFHCIRQMLQGLAGKSTVSKNTGRSICSVALVYAVLVFATPTSADQRRGHISNVKSEYF